MGSMLPYLWGPMAWRQIHGMAHVFDTRVQDATQETAELFVLFLIGLAWVLPCYGCRASYTEYLLADLKKDLVETVFLPRQVRKWAFDLHNIVNRKLNRPESSEFELIVRRSEMWSVEFLPRELFGLLFIIALSYDANQEIDKDIHFCEFFTILTPLLAALGNTAMSTALYTHLKIYTGVLTTEKLTRGLYNSLHAWADGPVPTYKKILATYSLCDGK